MVIVFVPVPVTKVLDATSKVSKAESSEDLQITIFPVPLATASEKVKTILLLVVIEVASSTGEEESNVGGVPATVELLVTLVELKVATSLPAESWMALSSSLPEGSVQVTVTASSFLTAVVRVSSTVEPETVASVTLLLEPPVVTAKAEVAAVVADKASLQVRITLCRQYWQQQKKMQVVSLRLLNYQ